MKKPSDHQLQFKFEMLQDKFKLFKEHFHRYKPAYFQNQGFVTFKTYKVAHEVKHIYNKAIRKRDFVETQVHKLKDLIKGKKHWVQEESKAKQKFRNVVLNKVLPKESKVKQQVESAAQNQGKVDWGSYLTQAANLFTGASDGMYKEKINLMKSCVGNKVDLTRKKENLRIGVIVILSNSLP